MEREARGRFHGRVPCRGFQAKGNCLQSERLPIVLLLLSKTSMTSFLFCDFSGLASLQLMRMNGVWWLLPLDRRFLAPPLTYSFETDSLSASQNTQLIQSHARTPDCDGPSTCHCSLHITSSTESPQLARQCTFVCCSPEFLIHNQSTCMPQRPPSLPTGPLQKRTTMQSRRLIKWLAVGSRGLACERMSRRLVGLQDRRLSFRCPALFTNGTTSRVESSLPHKRSCCCAPHLLQITPT